MWLKKCTSEQPPQGAVDLDKLSLEELNQAKQQEEGRLQALTGRYAQLRAAAARLTASSNAIAEISPSSEGKEVMIPLTESVYAPGKLREPNKLVVCVFVRLILVSSQDDGVSIHSSPTCFANTVRITHYFPNFLFAFVQIGTNGSGSLLK